MLGARPRALSLAALRRYELVLNKYGLNPTKSELAIAAAEWVRSAGIPLGKRKAAVRNFARDFERTRAALVQPVYAMGAKRPEVLSEQAFRRRILRAKSPREVSALTRGLAGNRKSSTRRSTTARAGSRSRRGA